MCSYTREGKPQDAKVYAADTTKMIIDLFIEFFFNIINYFYLFTLLQFISNKSP